MQLYKHLKARKHLPDNSIVITFDDGYDSYNQTIEYLNNHKVHSTFFICTPTFHSKYFYWDILNYLLIEQNELCNYRKKIILDLSKKIKFNLSVEEILDENIFEEQRNWKINFKTIPSKRCQLFKELVSKLEFENHYKANNLLEPIYNMDYDIEPKKSFYNNYETKKTSYVNFGSHTLNHYSLSTLSKNDQGKEILDNKHNLEELFDFKIKYFAYPFGSLKHYNKNSVDIVKSNFQLGLSNFPGLVHKDSNLYELPRFLIRDWPLDIFVNKISRFFNHK